MTAATLLAEIEDAGIRITLAGDSLRVQGNPGVDPAPYREQITANKPALLRELVQREMTVIATAHSEHFDRDRLDHAWQQWKALPDPEAEIAALVDQLESGWLWMETHPDHAAYESFFARWLDRLATYQQTHTAHHPIGDAHR